MPDEYGLPTAEEYEAQLRQAQQDALMAGRAAGGTMGSQVGGAVGTGIGAAFGAAPIGTAIGTAVGAGVGAGIGGLRARKGSAADRARGERVLAALEEAQREGVLSDSEYQEIANRFLVPTVAGQRAAQQQRLQQAAGLPGTQPGAIFRSQQAADAVEAENQLRIQAQIEAAAAREEDAQREELLRLIEGEEERAEDAEEALARRTDEAFAQFMQTADDIGTLYGGSEAVAQQKKSMEDATGVKDMTLAEFREVMEAYESIGLETN